MSLPARHQHTPLTTAPVGRKVFPTDNNARGAGSAGVSRLSSSGDLSCRSTLPSNAPYIHIYLSIIPCDLAPQNESSVVPKGWTRWAADLLEMDDSAAEILRESPSVKFHQAEVVV